MQSVMRTARHPLAVLLLLVALMFGISGCLDSGNSTSSAAQQEAKSRDGSYSSLVAAEPAHHMTYPATRKTINFWIDTWNKPGQLAYVYLQASDGHIIDYVVLVGPPVTMCAALTPTQQIHYDQGSDGGGNVVTNAPSVDGVYYSGGQCDEYYGRDATSGAYVEYSVGLGINQLIYTQPLPPQVIKGAMNLGTHK